MIEVPCPPCATKDDYQAWFKRWAADVVARWNRCHPSHPPFKLEEFDGCTFGLDICRHCCLLHDLRYHFRHDRALADRLFRECIAEIGLDEDRFGWWWKGLGWVYWAAVRVGGGWAWRS